MSDHSTQGRLYYLGGKRKPAQDKFFKEALQAAGWKPGTPNRWDTCWFTGMPKPKVFEQLKPGKTISHIPGNNSLTIKNNLFSVLEAARRRIIEQEGIESARRLAFFPRAYSMPGDYQALQEAAALNPDKRWILKPKNASRGRGISMVKDPAQVPREEKWMVQEYLDNPHLYHGYKYVLRLYVLITSVDPLRIYLYREGSAKLASEKYDPDNLDNLYAHLTNPDINATNEENPSAVIFLTFEEYRRWLREQGLDDHALFERIEEMLVMTSIAAREKMRERLSKVRADTSGCYELLGIDCLVDAGLKPWIMECNLSPSLDICAAPENGGVSEEANKRQLITDMVHLLGLTEPWKDYSTLEPEERIRVTAREELARAGGFKRLIPSRDANRYLSCFPLPRPADMILADEASESPVSRPHLKSRKTAEIIGDNRLSLYSEQSGTLYTPNETASWIWLKATDGNDPDRVADELLEAQRSAEQEVNPWDIRKEVWDVLADWAETGLLIQDMPADAPSATEAEGLNRNVAPAMTSTSPPSNMLIIKAGNFFFQVQACDAPIQSRLSQAFEPLLTDSIEGAENPRIFLSILHSQDGYAIADSHRLLAWNIPLVRVVPAFSRLIQNEYRKFGCQCLVEGIVVPLTDPSDTSPTPAVFVAETGDSRAGLSALKLAARTGRGFVGGVRLAMDEDPPVSPAGFPAFITRKQWDPMVGENPSFGFHAKTPLYQHQFESGESGYALPSAQDLLSRPLDIQKILLPSRDPSRSDNDLVNAMAVLLPNPNPTSSSSEKEKRTVKEVVVMAQWLEMTPCSWVDGDDLEAALPELHQTV